MTKDDPMSKTALAVKLAERQKELEASPRPFRTHYAGGVMKIGACKTAISAAVHAYEHVLRGDTSTAVVVGPDDKDEYRLYWTSQGILTWRPEGEYSRPKVAVTHRPTFSNLRQPTSTVKLRRVK